MKKSLSILVVLLTTLFSFNCCTSDEQMGFDISGIEGIWWEVDLGECDRWGDMVYSRFYFTSNAGSMSSRDGWGYERRLDRYGDQIGPREDFYWEVRNGNLYLDYRNGFYLTFYDLSTGYNRDYFDATLGWTNYNNRIRVRFYYVGGEAKEDKVDFE